MKKRLVSVIFAGAMMISLCACAESKSLNVSDRDVNEIKEGNSDDSEDRSCSKDIFAMDTYMTLTAYGERSKEAIDAAELEINRIEKLLSVGIETSEICKLNREKAIQLSEDTEYLIARSIDIYEKTDGAFEITIYPLMEEWGFTTQNYKVPDEERIQELLESVGTDKIQLETASVSIEKDMALDLGGIAKGYTSSRIMEIFREYGIESAVVSLGGNVQVLGKKTDGSDWKVGIESPKADGTYIGVLQTSDKAVITSGGYERYFEEEGKRYHHIIDPRTGYPASSGLSSVTIISEDGTLADALSTSLFIMGKDRAIEYWKDHSNEFDMIMVDEDGYIYASSGVEDQFSTEHALEIIYDM